MDWCFSMNLSNQSVNHYPESRQDVTFKSINIFPFLFIQFKIMVFRHFVDDRNIDQFSHLELEKQVFYKILVKRGCYETLSFAPSLSTYSIGRAWPVLR